VGPLWAGDFVGRQRRRKVAARPAAGVATTPEGFFRGRRWEISEHPLRSPRDFAH